MHSIEQFRFQAVYDEEQETRIRSEFTRLQGVYYMDHAGTTLYSDKQIEHVMKQLCENVYGNPHARNNCSKLTEDIIDITRSQILDYFHTSTEHYDVVFTSGATQSLKILGECFDYGNAGQLVYLQDNHTSVLGMRCYAPRILCLHPDEMENFLSRAHKDDAAKQQTDGSSLFVYPAQSNFSGYKYPLCQWIDQIHACHPKWFVAIDAASMALNDLNLTENSADFVTISFHKMFGYPTGLGALIIRNRIATHKALKKIYYGGGTVQMAAALENYSVPRASIHERFEDGTVSFLGVAALTEGFATIRRLGLSPALIARHTFALAQYVYENLKLWRHSANGRPVVRFYQQSQFSDHRTQGGIVNFNVLRDDGQVVGFSEVLHYCGLYTIQLRTGCFCNPGACQMFLELTTNDIKRHFEAGHVCGDLVDLVDGNPTGSVRVSFGYMSTKADADKLLEMLSTCFWNGIKSTRCLESRTTQPTPNMVSSNLPLSYDQHPLSSSDDVNQTIPLEARGILQAVYVYPIKSCAAFQVTDKWPLTSTGLRFDRQWMIVNAQGTAVTQKHNRKLCLIRPVINVQRGRLQVSFSDEGEYSCAEVPLELADGPYGSDAATATAAAATTTASTVAAFAVTLRGHQRSKVCSNKIQGWDCGDEIAKWLAHVLDYPGLRLLRHSNQLREQIAPTNTDTNQLSLANKAQYLLVNTSSVKWLRDRCAELDEETLQSTIMRFRANFVVQFDRAFVENNYQRFTFANNVSFKNTGKCTRCQLICVDQSTAQFSKEPLRTLSREFKGKITFGVYLGNERKLPAAAAASCWNFSRPLQQQDPTAAWYISSNGNGASRQIVATGPQEPFN